VSTAGSRVKVALVIFLLLVTPGCMEIIALPFQLVGAVFDVLFFWADAPEAAEAAPDGPALASAPADADTPVPLSVAVQRAVPTAADSAFFILAGDAPLPPEALTPPYPNAVPVAIPLLDRHLSPEAEAALEEAGIRLVR